jgi:hypothetical protein
LGHPGGGPRPGPGVCKPARDRSSLAPLRLLPPQWRPGLLKDLARCRCDGHAPRPPFRCLTTAAHAPPAPHLRWAPALGPLRRPLPHPIRSPVPTAAICPARALRDVTLLTPYDAVSARHVALLASMPGLRRLELCAQARAWGGGGQGGEGGHVGACACVGGIVGWCVLWTLAIALVTAPAPTPRPNSLASPLLRPSRPNPHAPPPQVGHPQAGRQLHSAECPVLVRLNFQFLIQRFDSMALPLGQW